tara:strand:+ start:274 stop:1374 length:1101 start_codon:yes stop_codon:yes gene_type:complete
MSKAAELANLIGNINAGGGGVNRNVIINGAMNVAQRGTSFTSVGASDTQYTLDRFVWNTGNSAGRLTATQDSSAPEGFANSLKFACTTADTSIAAGEFGIIQQPIEGQNVQQFAKGTSNAKPYAVSFYVKGNASATYVCELWDNDTSGNRQISKTFNVTTDWTRVELSFPADTTGALDDDNNSSFIFNIWLHGGSTYTGGTLNSSAWASLTSANRAAGISSFFDSTDRTFFITGVQLEVGQNPTSFEHEPVERTIAKCQRYYYKYGGKNAYEYIPGIGQGNGSTFMINYQYPVEMRAAPSINLGGDWRINDTYGGSYYTFSGVAIDNATTLICRVHGNTSSAIGSDVGRILAYGDIDAKWEHIAEL